MFPYIEHINDVTPHINDDLFVIAKKPGYIVINYNIVTPETFRHPDPLTQSIRRECRGIIFDSKTGNLIRRPLHKFFNFHEPDNEYTDLSNYHTITEKLDGSMIAPFIVDGHIRLGTKMGITDVSMQAEEFIAEHPDYIKFIEAMIVDGCTPIFEWCSRKQRIVLDYEEDNLVLIALRDMYSGQYKNYELMYSHACWFNHNIPVVNTYTNLTDMNTFVEHTRTQEDSEGFVITFSDGGCVKIKSDWYCRIHKALDGVRNERNIVALILDNQLDDIYTVLDEDFALPIRNFETNFWDRFNKTKDRLIWSCRTAEVSYGSDPKRVALEFDIDQRDKFFIFRYLKDQGSVRSNLIDYIKKNIQSGGKYKTLMDWLDPEETIKL